MEKTSYRIDAYSFGSVTINGATYKKDLLICPDKIVDKWWRKEGHSLYPEDLKSVVGFNPDIFIMGTGNPGRLKVPDDTKTWLTGRGIQLIELPTKDACERYNEISEDSKVIAGFHLTC